MKKLLYTLLAVSIIFSACKKEEEETNNSGNNNNNNNNSASIEGLWLVTSESEIGPGDTFVNNGEEQFIWFSSIEFFNDGSSVVQGGGDGYYWDEVCPWNIDSDTLYLLECDNDGEIWINFGYDLGPSTLTLTVADEDYIITTYATKQ